MQHLITLGVWVAVVGVVFAVLWWKGYLLKLSTYLGQTREELRKCTWPTWDELKGSTVLIAVCIVALGLFTFVTDRVFIQLVYWISKV